MASNPRMTAIFRRLLPRCESLSESADWAELFNGQDLSGWTGDTQGYVAEDGVLVCKQGRQESDHRERVRRFRVSNSNSSSRKAATTASAFVCPKAVTRRPAEWRSRSLITTDRGTRARPTWAAARNANSAGSSRGSIMDRSTASRRPRLVTLKPVGEWNKETIIAIEDHIMVILNGAVIVDTFFDHTIPVDGGVHPGMKNRSGHLVLAGHSDRVEFRNLRIADYSPPPTTAESSADNTPPAGFTALFNGRGLDRMERSGTQERQRASCASRRCAGGSAVKADENMNLHWSVIDGILTYDGKGPEPVHVKRLRRFRDVHRLEDPTRSRLGHLLARHAAGPDLGPLGSARQTRGRPARDSGRLGDGLSQRPQPWFWRTMEQQTLAEYAARC